MLLLKAETAPRGACTGVEELVVEVVVAAEEVAEMALCAVAGPVVLGAATPVEATE